jgi:DNA-binding phage protein
MTHYDPEEWLAAENAVKDVLSAAYANGDLDIPAPVETNLKKLAVRATKSAIATANHYTGTELYYS